MDAEDTRQPPLDWRPAPGASQPSGTKRWYECAIATARYGSPDAKNVQILRILRDQHLLKNELGRAFVDLYYHYSPAIADYIRDKEELKAAARVALKPLVWFAKEVTQ